MDDALLDSLRLAVGADQVLTDRALTASYDTDWTGAFSGASTAVIRVRSTQQLSAVLRLCHDASAPVVLQGGNTGLVGGATPRDGDIVLSLVGLDTIGDVDAAGEVTVSAGTTLAQVQHVARAAGWEVGVDLAARDSATIGGMVATNAGGIRVVRHGSMHDQVVGLEYVVADGTIVDRLHSPAKDNTGYDLVRLLAGSEGTLAAIARVRLRLVRPAPLTAVALLAFDSVEAASDFALRARSPDLQALELMLADGLSLTASYLGVEEPFAKAYPAIVLIELAAHVDPVEDLAALVESAVGVRDSAVAADAGDRARLWRLREAHAEAIASIGIPVKLDIAVPAAALATALPAIERAVLAAAPQAQLIVFGHLAEANMHVNVLVAAESRSAVTAAVLSTVLGFGGSISAEHGIGRAKAAWLDVARSPAEIAVLRGIKSAWDPTGILGRGVLLPDPSI